MTAKRQQKQQRFETLSVSIDLDATGRWLSINAQIGCFEALHQEIPSSEKFIHRPGKQPPSGSTNRQSENSQQKKQGVTFHLNEKKQRFLLSGYHVSLENFHSSIQMDRSLFGSGHTQIPAKLNHVNPMVTP